MKARVWEHVSSMRLRNLFLSAAACALAGCSSEPVREAAPAPAATAEADGRPVIVAFGDSITEGQGVPEEAGYPAQLERLLAVAGYNYRVVNEGVGGDTTSGGRTRVPAVTVLKPELVIVELGGNDGLRGLPAESTRANLEEIVGELKASGATVVLTGMTLPPNYGATYIRQFEQVFADVAAEFDVPLIAFRLEDFQGYMQEDAIHPTEEGHRRIAEVLVKAITPLLHRGG